MNPKAGKFFDAITLLHEDIVEEAQDYRFRRKQSGWKKLGSLAACLVLVASLSLLMLPRGCGGSAPADKNSSGAPPMQNADTCAPADEPASGEPMPAPGESPDTPEGGQDYGEAETLRFTAVVVEMDGDSILVEPLEGENLRDSYGQIVVVTRDLELPELAVGDEVRITYDGWIAESDPAMISGATAVERLEKD